MLVQNDILHKIVARFPGEKPNWKEIIRKFKEIRDQRKGSLSGRMSEMYVRLTLEKICADENVVFDPIKNGESAGEYNFLRKGEGVLVRKDKKSYCQIDFLLLVDGIPVLGEVKLRSYRLAVKSMTDARIECITDPIKKYFKTHECGYILVLPSDQVVSLENITNNKTFAQIEFTRKGGLIVPMYSGLKTLQEDIRRAKETYKKSCKRLKQLGL